MSAPTEHIIGDNVKGVFVKTMSTWMFSCLSGVEMNEDACASEPPWGRYSNCSVSHFHRIWFFFFFLYKTKQFEVSVVTHTMQLQAHYILFSGWKSMWVMDAKSECLICALASLYYFDPAKQWLELVSQSKITAGSDPAAAFLCAVCILCICGFSLYTLISALTKNTH